MRYQLLNFILLCLLSNSVVAETSDSQRIVKIGVSSALTGPAQSYGLDIKDAISFADSKLGNGRYKLIYEDDKCSGKDAVSVARKFIDIDKVDFVIGFACSGAALAAAPLYEKAKIPMITSFASSPAISNAGTYIFRTTPSDLLAARLLFSHVRNRGLFPIAILSEESEYTQDLKSSFIAAKSNTNTFEIIDQNFLPGTNDFRTQLLVIRSRGVKSIFINPQAEGTTAIILSQLKQIGWQPKIYGAYLPGSPTFLNQMKRNADGLEFVDTPMLTDILNQDGLALLTEFKAQYGEIRSIESSFASSFEAFRVVDAASRSNSEPREYIHKTKFSGIFGNYSFDENGDIKDLSFVIKTIHEGKAIKYVSDGR